jgi:hypothetical protein
MIGGFRLFRVAGNPTTNPYENGALRLAGDRAHSGLVDCSSSSEESFKRWNDWRPGEDGCHYPLVGSSTAPFESFDVRAVRSGCKS